MTEKSKNPVAEMYDQALENYEDALQSGLKLQQEAAKCWTKLMSQAASPQDWQKQATVLANEVAPVTQKNMEAYLALLEQTSRANVELLKKGLEAAQSTKWGEGQGKLVEFCEGSLKSLKASAQAIMDANGKAVESWIGILQKAASDVAEPKVGHA